MSLIAETFVVFIGFVLRVLLALLLSCLFLPICLIIFTPYLLVAALFSDEPYLAAIRSGYYNVYSFWRDYLLGCLQP